MKVMNLGWPESAFEYHPGYFDGLSYWSGRSVVISSGPTREMLDEVRFISNRSSGLMGVSLAEAFLAAGASVTLISGPAARMTPPGPVKLVSVESAEQMKNALALETAGADLLVMAAAVADFKPLNRISGKMERKGESLDIRFIPTPDVLASLSDKCPVLAFALEYGDEAFPKAKAKMLRKGAGAVFLNRGDIPGEGMETGGNAGQLIFADGSTTVDIPRGSKKHVAFGIAAAMGRKFGKAVNGQGS
jgi:phosphopantothenoylcysteine decarboxylase/phosphopantothenate--cysteine ligase